MQESLTHRAWTLASADDTENEFVVLLSAVLLAQGFAGILHFELRALRALRAEWLSRPLHDFSSLPRGKHGCGD